MRCVCNIQLGAAYRDSKLVLKSQYYLGYTHNKHKSVEDKRMSKT
jgi:hypothetical protein